ncbi:SPOR domain-containing protein [Acidovorax sp. SUPP3334]|uniref:SPOR domain-containing protein n=1 Tax=Acidovorax sp. SUPP3334 TaxID=2920881 RepID=UPI0023DE2DD5|nr:SPOR domain-containing protein [Acidovorax sp. SUPP3334]GKT25847.1 SPOR domain-containing protein [Acidovorax sp. SUPP3334]
MLAHTAYAAHAPIAPRRSDDSTIGALYRAAIGPINTDHYLPAFERLDTAGRPLPRWNWAAALFTLNWLVFRQLWGAALVYVAALEGVALLVFAVGKYLVQWPLPVLAGVLLAFLLAATVVPGLYGDAIFHADVRKRITKALSASATLPQAGEWLARHAATRRRLGWIVGANVALAVAALVVYLLFPAGASWASLTSSEPTAGPTPAAPAVPVSAASAPATTASGPLTGTPVSAPVPNPDSTAPASTSAVAPATVASIPLAPKPAPAPAVSAAVSASRASAPSVASSPSSPPSTTVAPARTAASQSVAPSVRATAATAAAASAPAPAASRMQTASQAQAPASTPASGPRPVAESPKSRASAAKPAASRLAPSPATTAEKASGASSTASAVSAPVADRRLYINVGLFAETANAQRAHARLRKAGLPATSQPITTASGQKLLRVRVGPFASASQANAAAAQVREMGLDASAAAQPIPAKE